MLHVLIITVVTKGLTPINKNNPRNMVQRKSVAPSVGGPSILKYRCPVSAKLFTYLNKINASSCG
jgi:hypothetical protein